MIAEGDGAAKQIKTIEVTRERQAGKQGDRQIDRLAGKQGDR